MDKRTKIIATIGPSCGTVEILRQMIQAGMNVARLNFSHGTHENHAELIQHIREAGKLEGKTIAIMQDLQGPKIRVGELPETGVDLQAGAEAVFDTDLETYDSGSIPVTYKDLHKHVAPGERLLLNDGRVETVVSSVDGTRITVTVKNSGAITSHKGINIPDSGLTISAITEKDKEDALFGVEHGVDFMALSFVTRPEDVEELRSFVQAHDTQSSMPIAIITKIERAVAVQRIDEIMHVADGIMVARGDLGIELPAVKVPMIQKMLIEKSLKCAKPVIVATQMLDSMQDNPRPTRAEVSDVANAVIDHADAVMLSNETATGSYPVETVQIMADIIRETEQSPYDDLNSLKFESTDVSLTDAVTRMSRMLAEHIGARLILASSLTGTTARLLSHYRPEFPLYVAVNNKRVEAQLQLLWGVMPFLVETSASVEDLMEVSMSYIREHGEVSVGDNIVLISGGSVGTPGIINKVEVQEII